MTQLFEYIKMAFQNLRSNKGRSLLTMLGIIIGISSVIMIISIGNGVKGSISSNLSEMSSGQIGVSLDTEKQKENMILFTPDDMDAIKENIPHVKGVTPGDNYFFYPSVTGKKAADIESMLYTGTVAMQYAFPEKIIRGSYFTDEDIDAGAMVCVISESGARKLYGGIENIVGMPIEIDLYGMSAELTICGIKADSDSSMLNMMTGAEVYPILQMPYTTMNNLFHWNSDEFSKFFIFAEDSKYTKDISAAAVKILESRYDARGKGYFVLENSDEQLSTISTVMTGITFFIVFVASISLLVGGIGVMNIMLVSVTERTREIGIRKALGARTKAIMMQFLSEAAMITLIGGIIGIVIGIISAFGICTLLSSTGLLECVAEVKVSTVLIATLFSSGVGLFFGIYPAKKAARLSPIEALRHE